MTVNSSDETIERAREAWQRHRQGAAWDDWMLIGKALVLGRDVAMREAEAKRPGGRRYNAAMTNWMERHGFDNMDKSDRCRLMECMANREAIENWRNTLTATQRFQCNYPRVVLRNWRRETGQNQDQAEEARQDVTRDLHRVGRREPSTETGDCATPRRESATEEGKCHTQIGCSTTQTALP
jgi:hypothetical protein